MNNLINASGDNVLDNGSSSLIHGCPMDWKYIFNPSIVKKKKTHLPVYSILLNNTLDGVQIKFQ